jgi:MoxR-like ATPase
MQDTKPAAALLQPEQLRSVVERTDRLLAELDRILLGQPGLHRLVVAGILSQGHVLLEGVPGVGKTAWSRRSPSSSAWTSSASSSSRT